MHHPFVWYSAIPESLAWTQKAAAGLSALGDILILTTTRAVTRQSSVQMHCTCWLITWLALADFIARLPDLANGPDAWRRGGSWCASLGLVHWYGKWASWMWVTAYAWVIHRNTGRLLRQADRGLGPAVGQADAWAGPSGDAWCALHTLCWGVPLLLVGAVYASGSSFGGQVGTTDGRSGYERMCGLNCPDRTLPWAELFTALLWPAVLYNIFAFLSVHCRMRWRVARATALLEPHQRPAGVTLWPLFLLYVLTFVVSQAPAPSPAPLARPPPPALPPTASVARSRPLTIPRRCPGACGRA